MARYWIEIRKKSKDGKTGPIWEEERKSYFEDRELRIEELDKRKELGEEWSAEVVRIGKEKDRREKWEKISILRYNS